MRLSDVRLVQYSLSHYWKPATCVNNSGSWLVVAPVPTRQYGSGLRLEPEPNRFNRSHHRQTRTVAIELVLPPKSLHFNLTTLAASKYLSSDRIVTWSICRLCRVGHSSTSRDQLGNPSDICSVAFKTPSISPECVHFFTATQRLLVRSPIWTQEVKERSILYDLRIDCVTIQL